MVTLQDILARGRVPDPPKTQSTLSDFVVSRVLSRDPEKASEIERICSIPVSRPFTDTDIEAIQQIHCQPEARASGFALLRVQAEAIQTFFEQGNLFGPIEVGGGKTLVSLRCIGIAAERGIHRSLLCVPSQVHTQLIERDIGWCRRRVPIGVTFYPLGGLSASKRRSMCGMGRRGCWVMPYSLLSAKDASEILEAIKPQLIVLDEAHFLKNRDAARTRRILTYCKQYNPEMVILSGTITSKSIKDYAHLLTQSLKENSPVPSDPQMVQEWAAVLDSEQANVAAHATGLHNTSAGTGPLRPLINWANRNFPGNPRPYDVQGFRWAFRDRLVTTPGVVSSPADALGTSLVIANKRCVSHTPRLAELMKQLEELWLTPSGDEIEFAMQKWKWATELSAGIYNDLVWPTEEAVSKKLSLTPQAATDLLDRSKKHHVMQQQYHRSLRQWFASRPHTPGLDTPMLVGSSMHRHGDRDVGTNLYNDWLAMKNAEFPGMLERLSVPVRVCDYKVKASIEWMRENPKGEGIVFWFHHTFGEWLYEEAVKAGLPVVYCPAGQTSDRFLAGEGAEARCKGKYLLCSLSAHGTGKNLQFLCDQLYSQIPISEQSAQQAIGRTHRHGQAEDTVTCTTLISNDQDDLILASLLNDAIYVYETTSSGRKLLQATWNPMPTIYGSGVLQRAGLQATTLNAKQQMMLTERFGKIS